MNHKFLQKKVNGTQAGLISRKKIFTSPVLAVQPTGVQHVSLIENNRMNTISILQFLDASDTRGMSQRPFFPALMGTPSSRRSTHGSYSSQTCISLYYYKSHAQRIRILISLALHSPVVIDRCPSFQPAAQASLFV